MFFVLFFAAFASGIELMHLSMRTGLSFGHTFLVWLAGASIVLCLAVKLNFHWRWAIAGPVVLFSSGFMFEMGPTWVIAAAILFCFSFVATLQGHAMAKNPRKTW